MPATSNARICVWMKRGEGKFRGRVWHMLFAMLALYALALGILEQMRW